jgi:beta-1,4-mannosyl-glycoprotein beta-1,4-N-acetylglucosaminyltransferase
MNIYDCFMYYDEDMVLDLRLNILNKYVKKFIITESIYTHSGKKRDLKFNINNFNKFKDKIEYIVVEDLPNSIENLETNDTLNQKNSKILLNALRRENYQRNRLMDGIKKTNENDLIIISDVDEIPNLTNFKYNYKFNFFIQKMIYYKLNLKHPNLNWVGSRACKKKDLVSPQWLRNIKDKDYLYWRLDVLFSNKKYFNINRIHDGGWHFTSIKSPEDIHFKLSHFLHHLEYEESKLNVNDMKKMIEEKKVLYDHTSDKRGSKWSSSISLKKIPDTELPEFIVENRNKYKNWLD